MINILYCVLHGSVHPDRYNNVINSWGKDQNLLFYSDTEDPNKNIVKVTDRTDYHSNEEKNVNVFKRIFLDKKFHNYDFYFFCDNDTFVNTRNLEDFLSNKDIDTNKLYGIKANSWPADKSLYYCGGGAGYIMSHSLLFNVFHECKNYQTGYSDVSVGLYAREKGIDVINCKYLHSFPPGSPYNFPYEKIADQISFHYIKRLEDMLEIEKLITNNL